MKVLYDHQIFSTQKFGGISRYIYEISNRNVYSKISVLYTENFYLKNKKADIINFKGKGRIINILNRFYSKYLIKMGNYDILHATYYNNYYFNILKKPLVITVHDMIHEIYKGKYFKEDDPTFDLKKRACERADGIIAISQKTKEDLIEILNIDPKKIKVIYHGSNLEKKIKKLDLPNKYILFVGGRAGYKNFNIFLEAINCVLKEDKEMSLLCIGSKFSNSEREKIKEFDIENQVKQILANDDEMFTIYKNAQCFVFPSLYEGFGIPILEAYESECPLVLSNTSCFPEIAEQAGEYFDPENIESIKSAINNVIYNEERRKELIKLGLEQLKKFSWEKTYNETIEFYKKIIKGRI